MKKLFKIIAVLFAFSSSFSQELTVVEYSDYRNLTFRMFNDSVAYIKTETGGEAPDYHFYKLKANKDKTYRMLVYEPPQKVQIKLFLNDLNISNDSVAVSHNYNVLDADVPSPSTLAFLDHIKLIVNKKDTFSVTRSRKSVYSVYPTVLKLNDTIELFNSLTFEKTQELIVPGNGLNFIEVQYNDGSDPLIFFTTAGKDEFVGSILHIGNEYCDFEFATEVIRMALVMKTQYFGKKRARLELRMAGFNK